MILFDETMTRNLAGTRGQQQWQTAGTEQLISSVGRSEGSDEHHSSKDNLAAALGAALAAAGLASGAVAVAVALHAAVAAVRDLRDLPTGLLKKFSEHSGVR